VAEEDLASDGEMAERSSAGASRPPDSGGFDTFDGGHAAGYEPAAPVEQLERVRLTRQKIEKWLLEPFFDRVVPGCYVRIGIGQQNGRPTYRVAEVRGLIRAAGLYINTYIYIYISIYI